MFTKHLYVPGNLPVTVSVREYSAVSQFVSVLDLVSCLVLSEISMLFLYQAYIVTGPPMEVQVRVNSTGFAVSADVRSKSIVVIVARPVEGDQCLVT